MKKFVCKELADPFLGVVVVWAFVVESGVLVEAGVVVVGAAVVVVGAAVVVVGAAVVVVGAGVVVVGAAVVVVGASVVVVFWAILRKTILLNIKTMKRSFFWFILKYL